MKRLTFQNQMLILGGLVVLAVALFYQFGWGPQMARLAELDRRERQQQQQLMAAQATLERLKSMEQQSAQVEARFVQLAQKMPPVADLPTLIVQMQDLINDAGGELLSFTPSPIAQAGDHGEMSMNMNVTGSWLSVLDLLYRLEHSSRFMKLNSVALNVSTYPDLTGTFQVTTFTMPPAGPPPAQDLKPAQATADTTAPGG